jgi:hypothetical protein
LIFNEKKLLKNKILTQKNVFFLQIITMKINNIIFKIWYFIYKILLFITRIKKKIIKNDNLLDFIILNLNFTQIIFFKKKMLAKNKIINLIER